MITMIWYSLRLTGVSERVGLVRLDTSGYIPWKENCQANSYKKGMTIWHLYPAISLSVRCLEEQIPGQQRTILLE
jgi:hypothetical protein